MDKAERPSGVDQSTSAAYRRGVPTDSFDRAKHYFDEYFKHWAIRLPVADLRRRHGGLIEKSGWHIHYGFGQDDAGEYLESYAGHRMTNDRHEKVYGDGRSEGLPAIADMYFVPDDPSEAEKARAEYEAATMRVIEYLEAKGWR
jgi:hypothetical protein